MNRQSPRIEMRGEEGPLPQERFPRKISRIGPLNLVGTARCAVRAAFSGATMPPADSRAGTSQRDVPTEVRFRGREKRLPHSGPPDALVTSRGLVSNSREAETVGLNSAPREIRQGFQNCVS